MSDPGTTPSGGDRRDFFRHAGLAAAVAALAPGARAQGSSDSPVIARGDVVLFQGDSITDDGRSRETAGEPNLQSTLGKGYAWMAASGVLVAGKPGRLSIFNRGVSGDRVRDLEARWNDDCLALGPDVLSILIGVNDAWHVILGTAEGSPETYEAEYTALLERTRNELPDVKLVIGEPFALKIGFVDDSWFPVLDEYRAAASRIAEAHGAVWVPYQGVFDAALEYAPVEHWLPDGVHPSPFGAALMAQAWHSAVGV